MNHRDTAPSGASETTRPERGGAPATGRAGLAVAVVLLALETLLLAGVIVWLVVELVVATPDSYASSIALTVVVALGLAWLAATTVGLARTRAWARPSAITWQVLQLSVALGAFQGLFARADIGWALLAPAVVVILLLLSRPVRERFIRPEAAAS